MATVLTDRAIARVPALVREMVRPIVTRTGPNSEANAAYFSRREQSIWPQDSAVARAAELVRSRHNGYCPTDKLEAELTRRTEESIRSVAGPSGSADAERLSKGEVESLQDLWIRQIASCAAKQVRVPPNPASPYPDWNDL